MCNAYRKTTSTASATINYATCSVGLCGGDTVTMSVCGNNGVYVSDTYLILVDSTDTQVSSNDDYCSQGSQLSYTAPPGADCAAYTLREGE